MSGGCVFIQSTRRRLWWLPSLTLQPPSPAVFHYIRVTMFTDFDFSWSPILITYLWSFVTGSDESRRIGFPHPPATLIRPCLLSALFRTTHSSSYIANFMLQEVFALHKVIFYIFILYFKWRHFAKCRKHKDIMLFKQVPMCVTVLSVSANHEHADCTVCVDKSAVMHVAETQERNIQHCTAQHSTA